MYRQTDKNIDNLFLRPRLPSAGTNTSAREGETETGKQRETETESHRERDRQTDR